MAVEVSWDIGEHTHAHGNHVHTHQHYRDPREHDGFTDAHGWHDPPDADPEATDHDDSFGEEPLSERVPSGHISIENDFTSATIVPYVPTMLTGDFPVPVQKVDVSASQYDYWDLMRQLFKRGAAFRIIEHDMAPTLEQCRAIWECPEPICAISYESYWGDIVEFFGDMGAMGFIAFKDYDLNQKLASCLEDLGPVTWAKLDGYVYRSQRALGVRPHVHPGQVEHRHVYPNRPVDRKLDLPCCQFSDWLDMELPHPWRMWLATELEWWHRDYLPVPAGGTVLDVGAGCGETARLYLRHGVGHVICIESDEDALSALRKNFGDDPRVTIVAAKIDKVKIDIEGAEDNLDLEVHFPFHWETKRIVGGVVQQRLVRN